ncbi:C2H2-type domain-containing protein [Mycena indigotica]|uniref:C2H2-type domain-containing protein n=1 Tax=Mycena indigotica TaxID=2126181 RepID=A0A8H6T0Q6_9AGAR|nr:C2H2-type domain-containing protein [Mycena indigotica]KAF7309830.1 C2H2-type domain-containing protein [Mycena indigotica]
MLDSLPALFSIANHQVSLPPRHPDHVPRAFLNLPTVEEDDNTREPTGSFHYHLAPAPNSAPHDQDRFYLPKLATTDRRLSDPVQLTGTHYTYASYDDPSPHTPDSPFLPGSLRQQAASDWKQEELSPPFFGSPQYAVRPDENTYGPSPPGTATSSSSTPTTQPAVPPPASTTAATNQDTEASRKTYSFVALPGNTVRKRPRRRYDEIERLYHCSWPDCNKAYGTLNHLNAHVQMQKHGPKRSPNEFKELRKQWRKAKKELESPSHHPQFGLGFGGVPSSVQLSGSAGPIRRSMSTMNLRRDDIYHQPYSTQQHQRSYSHGSTLSPPSLGVTIPRHHDSYGSYGVAESQSPQSAYSLTSASDYRSSTSSSTSGMPSSWPPAFSHSPIHGYSTSSSYSLASPTGEHSSSSYQRSPVRSSSTGGLPPNSMLLTPLGSSREPQGYDNSYYDDDKGHRRSNSRSEGY